ncbi:hypothetical protein HYALB_00007290 [Hymenoscyphus albidus]|uniref:F-box domain-containing protein n=1 Tax=Hymenoscyphus albidus TaxID=595503 RepID=A0A9N9QBY3_9HELO|nr:hypothetical protein HYALB_00007290 [Hymenoscyphus albidus]
MSNLQAMVSEPPDMLPTSLSRQAMPATQSLADSTPLEVWAIILCKLPRSDQLNLRTVCRKWNTCITPHLYTTMYLGDNISKDTLNKAVKDIFRNLANDISISCLGNRTGPASVQNSIQKGFQAYTKCLVIIHPLKVTSWNALIKLISRCAKLNEIKYWYIGELNSKLSSSMAPFPKALVNGIRTWKRNVLLQSSETVDMQEDLSSSLALAPYISKARIKLNPENVTNHKEFLLATSRLKKLTVLVHGDLGVATDLRLPHPLESIVIVANDWFFYSETNIQIWNFGQLKNLTLFTTHPVLSNLLQHTSGGQFPLLDALLVYVSDTPEPPNARSLFPGLQHTRDRLASFIISLPKLTRLKLDDFEPKTMVEAIVSKNGSPIKFLRFGELSPQVAPEEIERIGKACPEMQFISVNASYNERIQIVKALGCFKGLTEAQITLNGFYSGDDWYHVHIHETIEAAGVSNKRMAHSARLYKTGKAFRALMISQPFQRERKDNDKEMSGRGWWEEPDDIYLDDGFTVQKATSCFWGGGSHQMFRTGNLEDNCSGVFEDGDRYYTLLGH